MKKILIIHTAFIGDIILATPMIPEIKHAYPDSWIDFLTIPASANLLEKETDLNQLIVFDKHSKHKGLKGLLEISRTLKTYNYDICICPHRSLRSAFIAKYTNAKIRIGFDNSSWKRAFTHIVRYDQTLHETERNLGLLIEIGIEPGQTRPVVKVDNSDVLHVDSLIKSYFEKQTNLIAIAPGSVWATKMWGKDKYIDLMNYLINKNYTPVLIGGKNDKPLCDQILSQTKNSISLVGKLSLRQTRYFLTKCRAIVSNDSAPLHLGLAANIPVFAIFGPTVKEFGFAPIEKNSFVIENNHLNCRPCGIHGSKTCPTKTFDCMEQISVEQVINTIEQELDL